MRQVDGYMDYSSIKDSTHNLVDVEECRSMLCLFYFLHYLFFIKPETLSTSQLS